MRIPRGMRKLNPLGSFTLGRIWLAESLPGVQEFLLQLISPALGGFPPQSPLEVLNYSIIGNSTTSTVGKALFIQKYEGLT